MSYAPSTFQAGTGEDFFRKEGFLVDGMAPLVTARYTIPAFDDYDGTAVTITNSVAKAASGTAVSWAGWDLASSISKGLILSYVQPSTSNYVGVGFNVSTLPTSTLVDSYEATFDGAGGHSELAKYVSGSLTAVTTEATIFQNDAVSSAVWGIALYVDGSGNSQRLFLKSGSSNWIPVLANTESDHSSFQSFYLRHYGESARFISPIYCWGS